MLYLNFVLLICEIGGKVRIWIIARSRSSLSYVFCKRTLSSSAGLKLPESCRGWDQCITGLSLAQCSLLCGFFPFSLPICSPCWWNRDAHVSTIQLASFRKDAAWACSPWAFSFHLPYLVKLWALLFLERAVSPVSRTISQFDLVLSGEPELAGRPVVSVPGWGNCRVGEALKILSVYRLMVIHPSLTRCLHVIYIVQGKLPFETGTQERRWLFFALSRACNGHTLLALPCILLSRSLPPSIISGSAFSPPLLELFRVPCKE